MNIILEIFKPYFQYMFAQQLKSYLTAATNSESTYTVNFKFSFQINIRHRYRSNTQ